MDSFYLLRPRGVPELCSLLQGKLEQVGLPVIAAVALSSVLFTVAHASSQSSWQYLVLVFVAGVSYALSYSKTRAIEIPVLFHVGVNFVHLTLFEYPFR